MIFFFQVNAYNIDGDTPLCKACASGNLELVKLLLDHGAEINPGLNYCTPLHEVILGGGNRICSVVVMKMIYDKPVKFRFDLLAAIFFVLKILMTKKI